MKQKILKVFILVVLFNVIIMSKIYGTTKIYIDDIKANAGEEVTVEVNIEGNTGFVGSQIILFYDTSKLEYISSSNGNVLDGKMAIISNNESTSNVKQVVVGTDINANGNLMSIKFKVKDNVTDASIPLDLKVQELKNDNGSETLVDVEYTIKSGNIILSSTKDNSNIDDNNKENSDNDFNIAINENKSSITSSSVNDKVEVIEDENGNVTIKLKESKSGKVEYKSSDESIATVDENGNIIPKGTGEFTVTTMVNGQEIDKSVINILPEDLEVKKNTQSSNKNGIVKLFLFCIIAVIVITAIILVILKKKKVNKEK